MLNYISLIPTYLTPNNNLIISKLQGEYSNYYQLSDIKYDGDIITGNLRFTELYIETWIKRWQKEYGHIRGLDPVIKTLKKEYKIKFNSSGYLMVSYNNTDDENSEFIMSELEFHLEKISSNINKVIQGFDYGAPSLMRSIDVIGENIQINNLSNEISRYLKDVFREGIDILKMYGREANHKLKDTVLGTIAPFIFQIGYTEIITIYGSGNKTIKQLRDLKSSVKRICNNCTDSSKVIWENNCIELDILSDFFSNLISQIEFIASVYSSQVDVIGMNSTLIGMGLGLLSFYSLMSTESLRQVLLVSSTFFVMIGCFLWFFNKRKELVINVIDLILNELTLLHDHN